MANEYGAFKHAVWKAGIMKALQPMHIFVDGCEREYEGIIGHKGDRVKIHTMGDITIKKLTNTERYSEIEAAEHLDVVDLEVVVDQIAYFNVEVSNLDEAQSDTKIFKEFAAKAAEGFADEEDKFVANFANQAGLTVLTKVDTLTPQNVLTTIVTATQQLYKNNVRQNTEIEAIVPPEFYTIANLAKVLTDTNNSEALANGRIGRIGNVWIKMSNNVAKNTDTVQGESASALDMIQVRTRRACAFVEQVSKVIPYSPEKQIDTDALKGYILYGGKVLREKEIVILPIKAYNPAPVIPA